MAEIIIIGIAIGFNFIILKYKYDQGRNSDLAMDVSALLILSYLFGGTIVGMAAAMVGGALISLYLLYSTSGGTESSSTDEIKTTSGDKSFFVNW